MRTARGSHVAVAAIGLVLVAACADDPETETGGADETVDAESWEPEFVDGELQPLPDGFPEREITIVSVDEAGSRDGIYARTLDEALEGISPVDIIVSDEPRAAGGTMHTLADVLNREGGTDGYFPIVAAIPGTIMDFHVEPVEEETGLTPDDVKYFIATETHPWVLAQRSDAEWGPSFDAFVEYAREHPGELRYIAGGVGSGVDIAMEWLLSELEIEVEKVPAADRDAAMAAVGAGEGDITLTQPQVAVSAADRVDVTFVTTPEVPEIWADNPDVASSANYPDYDIPHIDWGTVQGLMIPAEVSDLHTRWLYTLFEAAVDTDVYQARTETNAGMEIRVYTTEESQEIARTTLDFSEPIIREIGLFHD